MGKEIKAVIFDLGGVLVGFKKQSFVKATLAYVSSPGNLNWGEKKAVEAHRRFELGLITPKQFYTKIFPFMREKISFHEFARVWKGSIFVWRPAAVKYLKQLRRAGYKIGILSNCDVFSYPSIMQHYKLKPFIDAAAPSYKVHSRKPDRKIFMAAARGLREKPSACIYIDDLKEYVEKARLLGMKAVHYKSLGQLKKELRALGVKVQ